MLIPYYHYIPISFDMKNLQKSIDYLIFDDKFALTVANNGFLFAANELRIEEVYCYYGFMFKKYSKLLDFKPEKAINAILLSDDQLNFGFNIYSDEQIIADKERKDWEKYMTNQNNLKTNNSKINKPKSKTKIKTTKTEKKNNDNNVNNNNKNKKKKKKNM